MIYFVMIWLVKLLFPSYWIVPTRVVYNQFRLEVGRGEKSVAFNNLNNLFGMTMPQHRSTTAKPSPILHQGKVMAKFSSKWSSIYDYFLRQKYFKVTGFNYISKTVDSGYATDKAYLEKWQDLNSDNRHFDVTVIFILIFIIYGVTRITRLGRD